MVTRLSANDLYPKFRAKFQNYIPAFSPSVADQYRQLFDTCTIRPAKYPVIDKTITAILKGRSQYQSISEATGIPWYFIGIIHNMESGCSFTRHLHNGDPLSARTIQVPTGYPKKGMPPFSFYDSALDALSLVGFTKWSDWSISGMLYNFEKYNGFGYRPRGINSPYLWSFSNHYSKGKYLADGKFNPNAVSSQMGTAVLLRRMSEQQIAIAGEKDLLSEAKNLAAKVGFSPKNYNANAEQLQKLLNKIGQHLRVDGLAGRNTSDASKRTLGFYLKNDPNA